MVTAMLHFIEMLFSFTDLISNPFHSTDRKLQVVNDNEARLQVGVKLHC